MRIALKFDVLGPRAARQGVPALLRLLDTYRVQASFAFATGRPSAAWTGRLGWGIGMERRLRDPMRATLAAGHEVGLAANDPRHWQRRAAHADAAWTRRQFETGLQRCADALGRPPAFCAAPGWQLNPHLLALEDRHGLSWCSDTRGRHPYLPQLQGVRAACVQIPTTLPTVPEVLAAGRASAADVHEYLYAESRHLRPAGHVFSADAEGAGIDWLSTMEKLIVMWKGQDGALRPLGRVYAELERERLPCHQVGWGRVPGAVVHLAMQGVPVPL